MSPHKLLIGLSIQVLLSGCSHYIPDVSAADNCCEMFNDNFQWYKASKSSEKKWGIPVPVQMAIIFQESSFKHDAIPDREYLFGFIPWKRKSSAYGYAQVLKSTWDSYEKSQPKWVFSRSRNDFDDATDFIGWYLNRASKRLNLKLDDAYHLYLAYHEGVGGYNRGSYQSKPSLKKVARKVENRATLYKKQIHRCHANLMLKHPVYAIFY
ncbi:MAG TPA: transglycosylase SLT domain-containing protein [Gammaproteobacteria bacterium]|nr:transglycosylase SLT domain-containing protein [Gammaproteobacteria bacterium]